MLRWIHMSDLHFTSSDSDNFNTERLRSLIIPYMEKQIEDVDVLFLTGDYRFGSNVKVDDAKAAAEFITSLCRSKSIAVDNVYMVPGNHDYDRNDMRTAIVRAALERYEKENTGVINHDFLEQVLLKDFNFYSDVEMLIKKNPDPLISINLHKVIVTNEFNIVLLNTAITSMDSKIDRGQLVLGKEHLRRVLEQADKTKATIMIGHHGHTFLSRNEIKAIQPLLTEYNVKLYLCGHEHDLWNESFANGVTQLTSGIISSGPADAGFIEGQIDDYGDLYITYHKWEAEQQKWIPIDSDLKINVFDKKYKYSNFKRNKSHIGKATNQADVIYKKFEPFIDKAKVSIPIMLDGHKLIGNRGRDGIRYFWINNSGRRVESLAFNRRYSDDNQDEELMDENQQISAYTLSTSYGCMLATSNKQCRFCDTGSIAFSGNLSAAEIAIQGIFMATYDADCPSYPEVRNNRREFAFMGQGEPAFNYPAIRESIRIMDIAMEAIDQTVERYVISTCGITDFVPLLIDDIRNGTFKNKVTVHFSLHEIDNARTRLMPINQDYDYMEFIKICKKLFDVTKTKIGVGILMLKEFSSSQHETDKGAETHTLTESRLREILGTLDKEIFRIDLCDLNPTSVGKNVTVSNEEANHLRNVVSKLGFEVRTFSSYGHESGHGCGMLKSEYSNVDKDSDTTIGRYELSKKLIHMAYHTVRS